MAANEARRIGLFTGRDWALSQQLMHAINERTAQTGVSAEDIRVGGTLASEPNPYRVILDRYSHEVPYYRVYLKNAVVQGVRVVNDPLIITTLDRFFASALLQTSGIITARAVALPNKDYAPEIVHDQSLRNLIYPMDWDGVVQQVGGFPAILQAVRNDGWKRTQIVHNRDELLERYNTSGLLTMMLQEHIQTDVVIRCFCIGDATQMLTLHPQTLTHIPQTVSMELRGHIEIITRRICAILGFDVNACDFAIRDGKPILIESLNPVPDFEQNMPDRKMLEWSVAALSQLLIDLAQGDETTRQRYFWDRSSSD